MRLVIAILLSVLLASAAQAQSRHALLIGNQGYADKVGPLKNPHHDIAITGKALETDGFRVTTLRDAGRRQVLSAVKNFGAELAKGGSIAVGFFYYSGHGVSRPDDRANYLIPVDLRDTDSPDFWFDAVKLDDLLGELERAAPSAAHFIVFDACRNELMLPGRNIAKGLEPVAQRNGMFIAFCDRRWSDRLGWWRVRCSRGKRAGEARPRPPAIFPERARRCLRGDQATGAVGQQWAVAARVLWRRGSGAATPATIAPQGCPAGETHAAAASKISWLLQRYR